MERIGIIMGKMHTGGKKNLVMEYYRNIDKTKYQFDFICDDDSNAIPFDEIKSLGGKVYVIPRYQKIFSNVYSISKICKQNKYKIVHGYNGTMNLFGMFAAKLAGVPIRINESISMGHRADKKNILKTILKPFSSMFSTHFAANGIECGIWQFGSKKWKKNKIALFKTVINTNNNKFDLDLRKSCRLELGIDKEIVFGHIGRLTAQKNSLFLIDIFAAALRLNNNIKMIIIGDGDLREEMLKKINLLHLNDKIIYLGRREDTRQFFNAMDCFLLPSLYEGLPVVGIEAQCSGLPVLFSTEVPRESSPCDDLGDFISLSTDVEIWAKRALEMAQIDRVDRSNYIANCGFDSKMEAAKLSSWYDSLLR